MLAIAYAVTGGSAYDFYAFDSAGLVWDGADWVAWADVDFESYRIPAAESGDSGRFVATLPDGTARYAMRASGADLAGSYLVWEEVVGGGGGSLTPEQAALLEEIGEKTSLIGTGQARWVEAGFSRGGDLRIVRGDSYGVAGGWPALTIVDRGDEWPDLTGATLRLTLRAVRRRDVEPPVLLTAEGTVGAVDGHQAALFTIEAGQTTALTPGAVQYDVEATWAASGAVATIVGPDAAGMVLFDQSPPPE